MYLYTDKSINLVSLEICVTKWQIIFVGENPKMDTIMITETMRELTFELMCATHFCVESKTIVQNDN